MRNMFSNRTKEEKKNEEGRTEGKKKVSFQCKVGKLRGTFKS